jgi:CBS domain-containing protein
MPNCKDVMTREPACCEPGDSITQVAMLMKSENVGSIPVIESREDRKLIGIVTDRDLVVKLLASGARIDHATVREAMTADPECCRENDDVIKAVERMATRQVRRMPIVDESGRLSGIIAQADVATRVRRDDTTGELVEAISEPGFARK